MKTKIVRMSYGLLAQILKGNGQEITSSAPSDLRCVWVKHDSPHNFIICVESETFKDVPEWEESPELFIVFTRTEKIKKGTDDEND